MIRNWLMVEHHRLHVVEQWPESPHRNATLAAIRKSIQTLTWDNGALAGFAHCAQCGNAPVGPASRAIG